MSRPGDTPTGWEQLRLHQAPIMAAAGLGVIFVFLFWDFLSTQVRWAVRHQADWGHTLVIPIIAGWFVWHRRDDLRRLMPFRTSWSGLIPVVFGVAWYTLCSLFPAVRNHNLQALGVWSALVGIVVLFFGYRPMRYLWFPLVFLLVFGQSTSDRAMTLITYQLQDIAAAGSHAVLWMMGFDVTRDGNMLSIFDSAGVEHPLNIVEACSGMRMLMAFLALGVAMAYTGLRRTWQRCIVVIMAVPTAIFVNILRVVTLSLLALVDAGLAADDFHSFVGILWLVPALFIYLGIIWIVRNLVRESKSPDAGRAATARPAVQKDRAAV